MSHILAISGKKQSGKDSVYMSLLGREMIKLGIVRDRVEVTKDGLWVSDFFGDKEIGEGIFDHCRHIKEPNNRRLNNLNEEYIWPFIKQYNFADALKKDVCMDLLGLSYESVYGTDEEKNKLTRLKWEDMPGTITEEDPYVEGEAEEIHGRLGYYYNKLRNGLVYHKPGPMSGRQVMEFCGTEIFRRMYSNIWANKTLNKVKQENEYYAELSDYTDRLCVICDCRFPNEVDVVKAVGGKVIRLTRDVDPSNTHDSNTALDEDNFDWAEFDAVVDNQDMSVAETNDAVYDILKDWGWASE